MKNYSWIILPVALFAGSALAIGACGGSGGGGGGGAGGGSTTASTGAKPATVASSTHASVASSTSTGGTDCTGLLQGDCGTCAEASCCMELGTCYADVTCYDCLTGGETDPNVCAGSQALVDTLVQCLQGNACTACFPQDECNPITNAPCDTAANEACDLSSNGVYVCFPAPNTEDACDTCSNSNGPFCKPGMHCMSAGKCSLYCCDDADCGPNGTCDKAELDPNGQVGICVNAGDGGMNAAVCDGPVPLQQPSAGSCFMLPP